MSKKKKIIGIAVVVFVIAAAAVASVLLLNPGEEKNRHLIYEGDPGKAAEQDGERMETFSIGVSSAVSDVHPYKHDDETMEVLLRLVYEPLLLIRNDASIEYRNAKEIVFEEQGKQASVKVNTDKCFSDGTRLNADMVLASYEWFLNEETSYGGTANRIEKVEKKDDETLIFTFYKPEIDNMEVFQLPIVYQADTESENGSTFLGTGPYLIDFLAPYQDVILTPNAAFQKEADNTKDKASDPESGYSEIVIGQMDYSTLDDILKERKYDMFYIDKEEMAKKVKESNAYDIYEMGGEMGYYLIYHMEESASRAVAKLCGEQDFFKDGEIQGVYSPGILSAYMKDPNYHSGIEKGSIDGIKEISILHDYDAVSMGIYENLSAKLEEEGVACQEAMSDARTETEDGADMLIYYGSYKDAVSDGDLSAFYEQNATLKAEEFYGKLEQYLTSVNRMTPLSKDTVWIASLSGKDTLDFFR